MKTLWDSLLFLALVGVIVLAACLLSGCGPAYDNDFIVRETTKCHNAQRTT